MSVSEKSLLEKIDEPPTCTSNLVIVGRNSRGNWVAQEKNGLFGGLFVSRAQAVKYALFENGHHPETIILSSNLIELDMHRETMAFEMAIEPNDSPQSIAA